MPGSLGIAPHSMSQGRFRPALRPMSPVVEGGRHFPCLAPLTLQPRAACRKPQAGHTVSSEPTHRAGGQPIALRCVHTICAFPWGVERFCQHLLPSGTKKNVLSSDDPRGGHTHQTSGLAARHKSSLKHGVGTHAMWPGNTALPALTPHRSFFPFFLASSSLTHFNLLFQNTHLDTRQMLGELTHIRGNSRRRREERLMANS